MQNSPFPHCALLLAFFCFANTVYSQTEAPLATDRPDQTEGSSIVPARYFQVEWGGVYEKEGTAKFHTLPSTLFRYGVGKRFELRFALDLVFSQSGFGKARDFGNPNLGFKLRLLNAKGLRPDLSLLYHLGLPMPNPGDDGDRREYTHTLRFTADHTLNENWGLGWNLGVETEGDEWLPIYTLAFGRGLSAKWGVFFEGYGDLPKAGEDAVHNLLFGGTWLPRPNLQLDASLGFGLTCAASDLYIGAGVSFRLPH